MVQARQSQCPSASDIPIWHTAGSIASSARQIAYPAFDRSWRFPCLPRMNFPLSLHSRYSIIWQADWPASHRLLRVNHSDRAAGNIPINLNHRIDRARRIDVKPFTHLTINILHDMILRLPDANSIYSSQVCAGAESEDKLRLVADCS
jgi:hypothetical protein